MFISAVLRRFLARAGTQSIIKLDTALELRDELALEAPRVPPGFDVMPPLPFLPRTGREAAEAIDDAEERALALAWLEGRVRDKLPPELEFVAAAHAQHEAAKIEWHARRRAQREAAWRYTLADAMLAERDKKRGGQRIHDSRNHDGRDR
jgi:hypothetical protein